MGLEPTGAITDPYLASNQAPSHSVTPPRWCPERESNPHGRSQRFLRPSRQPVAASGLDGALAEIRTRNNLALNQAPLPVGLQEQGGAWGRIRTDIVPGLSRHPLPVGIPRQVVAAVGLEPTSPAFQASAKTSSATRPGWWECSESNRVGLQAQSLQPCPSPYRSTLPRSHFFLYLLDSQFFRDLNANAPSRVLRRGRRGHFRRKFLPAPLSGKGAKARPAIAAARQCERRA